MKKIITIFLALFLGQITLSQEYKSAIIVYKNISEGIESKGDSKKEIELNNMITAGLNSSDFILKINSNGFLFVPENELDDEKSRLIFNLVKSVYLINSYYFESKNNRLFKLNDDVKIEMANDYKWEITKESKIIDNYLCYKAIYNYNFITRSGNESVRIITAWFTPEINFNYGPNGYMGLPGLILELEYNKTKLVTKRIELFKEEIEIAIPNKVKTVTEEEYINKIKQNFE